MSGNDAMFNTVLIEAEEGLASDKMELPAMRKVAQRCLEVLRTTDPDLDMVRAEVEKDPLLAAHLVRLGTRYALQFENIPEMLEKLGQERYRPLLVQLSAREIPRSMDRGLEDVFKAVCRYNQIIAILSRDLAIAAGMPSDEVYMCGLMQNVGMVISAHILLKEEKKLNSRKPWMEAANWITIVEEANLDVGQIMATKWRLSDSVANCMKSRRDYDMVNRLSPWNVVRLANAIAQIGGLYPGHYDVDEAEMVVLMGRTALDTDPSIIERVGRTVTQQFTAA